MDLMHQLADEIRETFDERGWKIEKALQLDGAFSRTRRSQSSLGRDLVLDAIEEAASRIGLTCRPVTGGGCDVAYLVDGADRRFRVRKASVDPETSSYSMLWTSDSIFIIEGEPEALFPTERWVLGYTVESDGVIADIFAARVIGKTEESVPHLLLGPATILGAVAAHTPPPGGGFQPPDEEDLKAGFHNESDEKPDSADAS
jgi:hypothetical protein